MDIQTNSQPQVVTEPANNTIYKKQNHHHHDKSSSIPKHMVLVRGFSRVQANEEILNETRTQIESSLCPSEPISGEHEPDSRRPPLRIVTELPDYSFMLPDLNKFDNNYKFKEYLQNDLIELPTQYALIESGHLNWWSQNEWEQVNRPLYPMVTSGDGNCLLHAASLAMWGLHDRYLILRKALHASLEQIKEGNESALWRRWKWEQMCQNRKYGLVYNEDEWTKEWQSLLKLSSYQPRVSNGSKKVNTAANTTAAVASSSSSSTASSNSSANQTWPVTNSVSSSSNSSSSISQGQDAGTVYFESLEEFHILLLAHILQRPIVVVADTMLHDLDGEPLSPVNFSGIYLPFECELSACHRYPLVLAYDSAHFSALVLMDNEHEDEYYDEESNIDAHTLGGGISKIERINKKIQAKPPYAVIPITYANKELLPIHFSHDPGKDYDWSSFPQKINNNSGDNNGGSIIINGNECELSRDEKMFLLQRYLDIVKMQLYDPGPTVRRSNEHVAINSSGMRVNISNVRVPEPFNPYSGNNGNIQYIYNSSNAGSTSNFEAIKNLKHTAKKTVNKKINKFLNLFKRNAKDKNSSNEDNNDNNDEYDEVDNNNNKEVSIKDHQIKLNIKMNKKKVSSYTKDDDTAHPHHQTRGNTLSPSRPSSTRIKSPLINNTPSKIINYNLFHKIVSYKSWNALFDSTIHHTCLIGVKLNLAKPPKFNEIVFNYIESAQKKFEFLMQHQQKNISYMTNQKVMTQVEREKYEHVCIAKRSDCKFDNLCVNCLNEYNKNSTIRSIALNNTNTNYNQYSYNTSNSNMRVNTDNSAISTRKSYENQLEAHQNSYDENCHFKSYYL